VLHVKSLSNIGEGRLFKSVTCSVVIQGRDGRKAKFKKKGKRLKWFL
jgi:hypothetical protein